MSNSPMAPSYAQAAATGVRLGTTAPLAPSGTSTAQPTPAVAVERSKKKMVIGQSQTAPLRAAKQLNLPKSVYSIRNIDACYSADDLKHYLQSELGVRVLSCFERTSDKSRYVDNKTFRVCILDADKAKLLSDENWAFGVCIQKWSFKPKVNAGDGGPRGTEGESGDVSNSGGDASSGCVTGAGCMTSTGRATEQAAGGSVASGREAGSCMVAAIQNSVGEILQASQRGITKPVGGVVEEEGGMMVDRQEGEGS